eukprot:2083286-Rhodomonas_salina.2
MGKHINTNRSLREMAVHRLGRIQFSHCSRHETRGTRFLCTQKTARVVLLREWLVKQANHLAADLMKSKKVLRVQPDAWAATD